MSTLKALLKDVPVEWKALGDVATFRRGSFPQPYGNSEWYDGEGSMPFVQVVDVSEEFRLNHTTKNRISKIAQPKSIFVPNGSVIVTLQGSIGRVAITQYDSYVDRTIAIFENYLINIDKKYFAYQLKYKFNIEKENARGSTIKTITKEEFSKFQIPIPYPNDPEKSLAIQQEIVRVLDGLSEQNKALTTALAQEIDQRKKQYAYYREDLFRFEGKEVEWKELKSVFNIRRGKRLIKSDLLPSGKYAVFQNSMTPLGYYEEFNVKSDTTFIISAGSAGEIGYSYIDFWAADDVYFFEKLDNILSKFLYYFLLNKKTHLSKQVRRSSVPRLSKTSFEKYLIPVPSIQEQERIVRLLDQFDEATKNIVAQLEKEIELRNKQYEYYRNQLLAFRR